MCGRQKGGDDMEREVILRNALSVYGHRAQILVAAEECAELAQALLKYTRRDGTVAEIEAAYHVREEMADVQIMLDQLYILFGKPRDWERRKLERLAHRLAQDA